MTIGDATLPLQKAIIDVLRDAGTNAGERVFSETGPGTQKPYVTIGPIDVLTEEAQDYEGSETTVQIDGWSGKPTSKEVKELGRDIRAALHEQTLSLEENQRLVSLTVDRVLYQRDPDGTHHAIVTVNARTEPTA